ncbi:hypothetical protein ACFW2Y_13535 [Streptomyces sp. NPDC058877]|uniref:hypothetical protein n=1 Tax=Streptomyces sp. NPDC058877 TaxID=3346665 RepID=UPI0036B3E6A0
MCDAGRRAAGREELTPCAFFADPSLSTARPVDPGEMRAVVSTAVTTALATRGPTVPAVPAVVRGFARSAAGRAFEGALEDVIETVEHNARPHWERPEGVPAARLLSRPASFPPRP